MPLASSSARRGRPTKSTTSAPNTPAKSTPKRQASSASKRNVVTISDDDAEEEDDDDDDEPEPDVSGSGRRRGRLALTRSKGSEDEEDEVNNSTRRSNPRRKQESKRGSAGRKDDEDEEEEEDGEDGDDDEVEAEYEIEKIEKHKRLKDGTFEYYIKWKGYPTSENTWEPEKNVSDAASKAYWGSLPRQKQQPSKYAAAMKRRKDRDDSEESEYEVRPKRGRRDESSEEEEEEEEEDEEDDEEAREREEKARRKYDRMKDWSDKVKRVDTLERDDDNILRAFVVFNDGEKLQYPTETTNVKCPQQMLAFYEAHLRFKVPSAALTPQTSQERPSQSSNGRKRGRPSRR